jgi:hypothetical protein
MKPSLQSTQREDGIISLLPEAQSRGIDVDERIRLPDVAPAADDLLVANDPGLDVYVQ